MQKQRAVKVEDSENPIRAAVVIKTLTAVTMPHPKRRIIRSLAMLETTVPPAMSIEIIPA
ncbi:hypothetical protein FACS1894200_05840 [Spirochaetia bacterium]|nr:hypothetical protein FACS1894200_05840 [Spirochaetia bacterium]